MSAVMQHALPLGARTNPRPTSPIKDRQRHSGLRPSLWFRVLLSLLLMLLESEGLSQVVYYVNKFVVSERFLKLKNWLRVFVG